MEFHVELSCPGPDPVTFGNALLDVDPMAIFAIHPSKRSMEVSAVLEASGLQRLLAEAGCVVSPGQIEPIPALCCGECST